mmetsp:Transcript_102514/g.187322  ORF Transcript_102514/g.187322 Transcript_102514/m.187322 type:complete len:894 (+) Transcript_102514:139-2820(+)
MAPTADRENRQRRQQEDRLRRARMTQAVLAEFSDVEAPGSDCGLADGRESSESDIESEADDGAYLLEAMELQRSCGSPDGAASGSRGPLHIVLVTDVSGSMRQEDVSTEIKGQLVRRSDAVLEVLKNFIDGQQQNAVRSGDKYSMISFNRVAETHFVCEAALDAKVHMERVAQKMEPQDHTNYIAGLRAVSTLMDDETICKDPAGMHFRILLFSDGCPGDVKPMLTYFQSEICSKGASKVASLEFHTVGFGDLDEFVYLQQMSSIGHGTFQLAGRSLMTLRSALSTISSTVSQAPNADCAPPCCHVDVQFEQPRLMRNEFRQRDSLSFICLRHSYSFNGKAIYESALHEVRVSCRPQPWTQGGMHVVYAMQDNQCTFYDPAVKRLCPTHMVAKVMKSSARLGEMQKGKNAESGCGAASLSDEPGIRCYAENVALAAWCAKAFRERLGHAALFFVPCFFYDSVHPLHSAVPVPDFVGERHIHGVFTKYNNNKGFVQHGSEESLLAQAFSHFSFELTQGDMMVVDIQGVCIRRSKKKDVRHGKWPFFLLLSDPQVLSSHKNFGAGDLGVDGMRSFFRTHRCNSICCALGLEASPDLSPARGEPITIGEPLADEDLLEDQQVMLPSEEEEDEQVLLTIRNSPGCTERAETLSEGPESSEEVLLKRPRKRWCQRSSGQASESGDSASVASEPSGLRSNVWRDVEADDAMNAVEVLLERKGHTELADKMFVYVASGPVARRAVAELFHMHYNVDLQPKRNKDELKFIRRLGLLLETSPATSRLLTPSLLSDASSNAERRHRSRGLEASRSNSLNSLEFSHGASASSNASAGSRASASRISLYPVPALSCSESEAGSLDGRAAEKAFMVENDGGSRALKSEDKLSHDRWNMRAAKQVKG